MRRFPFHVREVALQGIQRGPFPTASLLVGGHLTVSHKMEKLRLSHLSSKTPRCLSLVSRSPRFPKARLSSSTRIHCRIFNDFTRFFRFISPIRPLISPASNIVFRRPFLSFFKGPSVPWPLPLLRQIFPFGFRVFFVFVMLEIRVHLAYWIP